MRRGRHAPTHQDELTFGAGVADDRCGIIRKHSWQRREITNVPVDHAEQRADGFLVCRDAVEIADVDGPPLVRMVADF